MTVAPPTHEPAPLRTGWRSALIRWLRGGPAAAPTVSSTSLPSPDTLSLPRLTPPQLRSRAHEFFRYGEELAQRGAPDLAAPFYRQAFTLLECSLGGAVPPAEFGDRPPAAAGSVSAAEPPADPSRVLPASPPEPPPPAAPLPQPPSPAELAATLARLRQSLSRETAPQVLEVLQVLQRQGVRDPELHRLAGLAHLSGDNLPQAEAHFRRALALDPDHYAALVNLSGIRLTGRDHEAACALLERALRQVDPDSAEAVPALSNLALAHEQAGRAMEAARLIVRVHQLRPGHLRPSRLLQAAETLEQMGEDVAAIELLRWVRQQQPAPEVLQRLATLLERRGEYREAALVYRDLLGAEDPTPSDGR